MSLNPTKFILVLIFSSIIQNNTIFANPTSYENFCNKHFFVVDIDAPDHQYIKAELIVEIELAISSHYSINLLDRKNYPDLVAIINKEIGIQKSEHFITKKRNNIINKVKETIDNNNTIPIDFVVFGLLRRKNHGSASLEISILNIKTKASKIFTIDLLRDYLQNSSTEEESLSINSSREELLTNSFAENIECLDPNQNNKSYEENKQNFADLSNIKPEIENVIIKKNDTLFIIHEYYYTENEASLQKSKKIKKKTRDILNDYSLEIKRLNKEIKNLEFKLNELIETIRILSEWLKKHSPPNPNPLPVRFPFPHSKLCGNSFPYSNARFFNVNNASLLKDNIARNRIIRVYTTPYNKTCKEDFIGLHKLKADFFFIKLNNTKYVLFATPQPGTKIDSLLSQIKKVRPTDKSFIGYGM